MHVHFTRSHKQTGIFSHEGAVMVFDWPSQRGMQTGTLEALLFWSQCPGPLQPSGTFRTDLQPVFLWITETTHLFCEKKSTFSAFEDLIVYLKESAHQELSAANNQVRPIILLEWFYSSDD